MSKRDQEIAAAKRAGLTEVRLKDKYSGGEVWLTIRGSVVVGVMGSDPHRYMGMTLDRAKHYARYGGKATKSSTKVHHATKATPATKATKATPATPATPATKATKVHHLAKRGIYKLAKGSGGEWWVRHVIDGNIENQIGPFRSEAGARDAQQYLLQHNQQVPYDPSPTRIHHTSVPKTKAQLDSEIAQALASRGMTKADMDQEFERFNQGGLRQPVEVDTSWYRRMHGAEPRGRRNWVFVIGKRTYEHNNDRALYRPGIEGYPIQYASAKKHAIAETKRRQLSLVAVSP